MGFFSDLPREMIRLFLVGSAVTMVLKANCTIYTHLEIWLVWKTESTEVDTILANKVSYNPWQLYLLSILVICVHRKVLLNDLDLFFSLNLQ